MDNIPITTAIRKAALDHALPFAIVAGIVHVESAGNPWAHRFEPAYTYLWNVAANRAYRATGAQAASQKPPADFRGGSFSDGYGGSVRISPTSEWIARKTSWGLMQLMGANARSYGFDLPLPALCEPEHGLDMGCRHLAALKQRGLAQHGWRGVVDAWNDGTWAIELPEDYPDLVAKTSPEAAALLAP